MQSHTNEAFLQKRVRMAKYAGLVGFGALVAGLFTVTVNVLLSYLMMGIGLVGATIASYMTNQYVREPRPDRVLGRVLDGLDKRYVLYNYFLPSSHVVASHHGLTVLLPRVQKGVVTFASGRWRHRAGWRRLRQFFGEPSVGQPEKDLQYEITRLHKWVNERYQGREIPVSGAVVFVHPEVVLQIDEAPGAVLRPDELPAFFRQGLRDGQILSTAEQRELRRLLDDLLPTS
jgi:hypothetical protein